MKTPTVERVFVTPKMARDLLKLNTKNRPLSAIKVTQYGCDMLEGKWNTDSSMIMVSTEGVLMNGQHRLHALVEADVTGIHFVIMRGAPPDAMETIDCGGKPRSVGENLALLGEAQGVAKAQIANAIFKLTMGRNNPRPSETKETLEKYRRGIEWVLGVTGVHKTKFSAASVRGAFALSYLVAPAVTQEVADRALSGVGCSDGDAALAIRTLILSFANEGSPGRMRLSEKILHSLQFAIEKRPVLSPKPGKSSVEFFLDGLAKANKLAGIHPKVRRGAR